MKLKVSQNITALARICRNAQLSGSTAAHPRRKRLPTRIISRFISHPSSSKKREAKFEDICTSLNSWSRRFKLYCLLSKTKVMILSGNMHWERLPQIRLFRATDRIREETAVPRRLLDNNLMLLPHVKIPGNRESTHGDTNSPRINKVWDKTSNTTDHLSNSLHSDGGLRFKTTPGGKLEKIRQLRQQIIKQWREMDDLPTQSFLMSERESSFNASEMPMTQFEYSARKSPPKKLKLLSLRRILAEPPDLRGGNPKGDAALLTRRVCRKILEDKASRKVAESQNISSSDVTYPIKISPSVTQGTDGYHHRTKAGGHRSPGSLHVFGTFPIQKRCSDRRRCHQAAQLPPDRTGEYIDFCMSPPWHFLQSILAGSNIQPCSWQPLPPTDIVYHLIRGGI
ncbi:hypothetical protein J6590_067152 [Homalodisca vitripennis]|nr:hypothetical protein J6590_067152 [Homalodisca vitripennis]